MVKDPGLVLIDIRTKNEVDAGYIPGAEWMDVSDLGFITRIGGRPKDKTYCLYCASGGRTSMVVPFLKMKGFKNIFDLRGGIKAWVADGGEVIRTNV